MKMERIYLVPSSPELSDAIIDVPGFGKITVKGNLPPDLQRAVEEHFFKLLDARVTVHAPIITNQPQGE